MKSLACLVALAFVAAGCTKPLPPSVPQDSAKLVACIAQEIESGVNDPIAMAAACGTDAITVVSDIAKVIFGQRKAAAAHCSAADAGAE